MNNEGMNQNPLDNGTVTSTVSSEENQIMESAASGIESTQSISQPQGSIENQTVVNEEAPKGKKKSKIPVIIIGVLLCCTIVCGVLGFVRKLNTPFESAVSMIFKELSSSKFLSGNYKTTVELSGTSELEELKDFNNFSLKMESSYDKDNLVSLFKATILKDKKELIDLATLLKDNKIYLKSSKLFDKVLYYDLNELIGKSTIKIDDIEFLIDKAEEGLKNAFKDEKLNKETQKIKLNGKENSFTNNYYVITEKASCRIEKNFLKAFADDKTYEVLARLVSVEKSDAQKLIEDSIKELEEEEKDADDNASEGVKFGIYTSGLLNDVAGFNASIPDGETFTFVTDGENVNALFKEDENTYLTAETLNNVTTVEYYNNKEKEFTATIKKDKDNYDIAIIDEGKTAFTIKVKCDGDNYDITFNVPDIATANMKISYEKIKNVESFDTSNAKLFSDLTSEDSQKMVTNLEKVLEEAGLKEVFDSLSESAASFIAPGFDTGYDIDNDDSSAFVENKTSIRLLAQDICEYSKQEWILKSLSESGEMTFSSNGNGLSDYDVPSGIEYEVNIDKAGKVTSLKVTGDFYSYDSGKVTDLNTSDITDDKIKSNY